MLPCVVLPDPEELREARLDEAALLRLEDVLLEGGAQLLGDCRGLVVLDDAAAHPDHVGQRPVGDALAVREAAAAVPVDRRRDAVEVLVELPAEARLADAGDAGDRDEMRLSLVGAEVKQVLDLAQLAIASDEGRLEALRLLVAAAPGHNAQGLPQLGLSLLALELVRTGALVDDRLLARAPRGLSDEHGAGLCDALDPGSGVHDVPGDHALPGRSERDGRLAGQDAGPGAEILGADLLPQGGHGRNEIEPGAHGALGVILGGRRRPPHGHHRIADELLDAAPVELDQPSARVEVPREQRADFLRVARLRQRGEPDQVGEEHGHEPPFGDDLRRRRRDRFRARRRGSGERRPAVAAELAGRRIGRSARRTAGFEPAAALAAEALAGGILRTAARAGRHTESVKRRVRES